MSYLELPAGLADFDKAVISFWFRVPNATIQSVLDQPVDPGAEDDGFGTYLPPLYKLIPLITFGSVESAFDHQSSGGAHPLHPISPSFIGVDCSDDSLQVLAVNLQMSNSTTFSSEPQFIDQQYRPDAFYMGGYGARPYTDEEPQMLEVTPDHWHHVLISFDLSLGCSCYTVSEEEAATMTPFQITPGPTFTWAFDDEDQVGPSMASSGGAMWVSAPGSTHPMAPIPDDSIIPSYLVGLVQAVTPDGITATWNPVPLSTEDNSIGLPTAAQFVDSVYPIELAELQFFTGVTTDTRIEANRRAFIDADGVPVPPTPTPDDPEDPESPLRSPAERLLGKPPDILLHGSGNWIIGKNTGPPMIDNPDYDPGLPESADNPVLIPDPDFQFEPTGKIVAYTPDPSLHGPQSPPEPETGETRRRRRMAASLTAA
jgi:hypothetical protein